MSNKISLVSLGCAKNLVDSEILIGGLKSEKYEIVTQIAEADTIIINTCVYINRVVLIALIRGSI